MVQKEKALGAEAILTITRKNATNKGDYVKIQLVAAGMNLIQYNV